MIPTQKIAICSDGVEEPYSHPAEFKVSKPAAGAPRIIATVPYGRATLIPPLLGDLDEPILLLYVLHTTRGEARTGRYQSQALTRGEVVKFLKRFDAYLQADARFDLWMHSPSSNATMVWDRHNLLYLYGPIANYEKRLVELGFHPGDPNVNFPHAHYYRAEFDVDAREVLQYFNWQFSELRQEDIQ